MTTTDRGIDDLVQDFVRSLSDAIFRDVCGRAEAALEGGVIGGSKMRPRRSSGKRRLQGVYLGKLRKLRGRNRVRVRSAARTQGVAAAVALADKLLAQGK